MAFRYACSARTSPTFIEEPVVFLVDGDQSIREALDVLIRSAGYQARPAASAEEFLACPRVTTPSCVLAELHLPGLSGLDLQRLMSDRREMPIILMSEKMDVQAAVQAIKGGALEVLLKPLVPEVLLCAIRNAIDRSRAALTLQQRYESLSAREREVMSLVVSGLLNKRVGGELGITEFTVKLHRGRVMRKMKAGSLAALVTMAARLGVPLPVAE